MADHQQDDLFGLPPDYRRDRLRIAFITSLVGLANDVPARDIAARGRSGQAATRARQIAIYLAASTVAKLTLYEAMREKGVTQSELARRLGCHRQHAARIVDPAHNTKFEVLEAALAAVGKRAGIVISDAA